MEEKGESFLFALSLSSQQSFVYLKKNNCQARYYLTFMHSYLMLNLSGDFLSTYR